MKIRNAFAFAVVFSAIGVFLSSNIQTTESAVSFNKEMKCAILPFQRAFQESKSVFVGNVVSEEKNGDTKTFKFEIEKYWKGGDKQNIEINVYETARYQAFFKKGERYLIYATADEDGKLRDGRCSRSRDLDNADEDLRQLGKGKIPR